MSRADRPYRYPWIRRPGRLGALGANLHAGSLFWLALFGVAFGSYLLRSDPLHAACSPGFLLLTLLAYWILRGLFWSWEPIYFPHFSERLEAPWIPCRSLSAAWPGLDEEAAELGVTPPSEFRFRDQRPWHDASDGLRTFSALLAAAEQRARADEGEAREELQALVDALTLAEARSLRFVLHMRAFVWEEARVEEGAEEEAAAEGPRQAEEGRQGRGRHQRP